MADDLTLYAWGTVSCTSINSSLLCWDYEKEEEKILVHQMSRGLNYFAQEWEPQSTTLLPL